MFQRNFAKSLALLLTLSSVPAYAGLPFFGKGDCTSELGVTAAYLRLAPDYRTYGTSNGNLGFNSMVALLKVQPLTRFGGGVDYTYGGAVKVNFNYFETHNRRGQSQGGVIGTSLLPPLWGDQTSNTVFSQLESQYRIMTLAAKYPFSLASFTLTPSLGVSHLFLRHNHVTGYFGLTNIVAGATGASAGVDLNSKFKGYGPSFGAMLEYGFCDCLSIFANLQYTPYIGNTNGRYRATRSATAPVVPATGVVGNYDYAYKTHSTVVTHTQADLGFGWSKEVDKCYNVNLRFGYRIVKIIGGRETSFLTNAGQAFAVNNSLSNSNLHGPFLRLGLKYKL